MMPPIIHNKQALNLTESLKVVTNQSNSVTESSDNKKTTPQLTENKTSNLTNTLSTTHLNRSIALPVNIQQALSQITQILGTPQPLARLLADIPQKVQPNITNDPEIKTPSDETNHIDHELADHLFRFGVKLTGGNAQIADQLQQSLRFFNTGIKDNSDKKDWREALIERLSEQNEPLNAEEQSLTTLAHKWLSRSHHNAFMQQLQLNTGNAVLLQDIPIFAGTQWIGAYLEIEQTPTTNTDEYEWKLFIQFPLPDDSTVSAKLALNAHQELHVYLWADTLETVQALQQNTTQLSSSLHDLGLLPQHIIVAKGIPTFRKDIEKPSVLAGSVNITT